MRDERVFNIEELFVRGTHLAIFTWLIISLSSLAYQCPHSYFTSTVLSHAQRTMPMHHHLPKKFFVWMDRYFLMKFMVDVIHYLYLSQGIKYHVRLDPQCYKIWTWLNPMSQTR